MYAYVLVTNITYRFDMLYMYVYFDLIYYVYLTFVAVECIKFKQTYRKKLSARSALAGLSVENKSFTWQPAPYVFVMLMIVF